MLVLARKTPNIHGVLGVLTTLMILNACSDAPAPSPTGELSETTSIGDGQVVANVDLAELLRTSLQAAIEGDLPVSVAWNRLIVDAPKATETLGNITAIRTAVDEVTRENGWASKIDDASGQYTCLEERPAGQSRCRIPEGTLVVYFNRVRVTRDTLATVELGLHGGVTETVMFRRSYVFQLKKAGDAWNVVHQKMGEL